MERKISKKSVPDFAWWKSFNNSQSLTDLGLNPGQLRNLPFQWHLPWPSGPGRAKSKDCLIIACPVRSFTLTLTGHISTGPEAQHLNEMQLDSQEA